MEKVKNLKEAKELAEKYLSISIEDIKKEWDRLIKEGDIITTNLISIKVMNSLTGFGNQESCSLCLILKNKVLEYPDCSKCIYNVGIDLGDYLACVNGHYRDTYLAIMYAANPEDLKKAVDIRANGLLELIEAAEYEEKNEVYT